MITKTAYILSIDELKKALYEFLNADVDDQYGTHIDVDTLHKIDVVKDDSGVITAVEFHTETEVRDS